MNKYILLGITFALAFAACGQSPIDNGGAGITTFPLTIGDRWVYYQKMYDIPFGNPLASDTLISATIIRRVVGTDSTYNPQIYVIVDDSITQSGIVHDQFVERHWYRLDENKLKEYASALLHPGGDTMPRFLPSPNVLLDFPLTVGKRWLVTNADLGPVNRHTFDTSLFAYNDRSISCALVRTESPVLNPPDWVEWYANEGLMYRHIDYGLRYRIDEHGNPVDSAFEHDVTILVEMNLED